MADHEQNITSPPEGAQCITCGYDLRTLDIESSCPECDTSIESSIRVDFLAISDSAWVAKLAEGQLFVVIGTKLFLITFLIGLVVLILLFIAASLGLGIVPQWVLIIFLRSVGIGIIVAGIIAAIGCFRITTLDPQECNSVPRTFSRLVVRVALFAFPVSSVILLFCSAYNVLPDPRVVPLLYAGIVLFFGILISVTIVSTLKMLADLAKRIPNHVLRGRTLKARYFYYWAILVFVTEPTMRPSFPGGLSVQSILVWLLICASFILGIVIFIKSNRVHLILREYRKAFRKCATEAATANNS